MYPFDHGVKPIANYFPGDGVDARRHVIQVVEKAGLDVAAGGASVQLPGGVSDFGKGGSRLRRDEEAYSA